MQVRPYGLILKLTSQTKDWGVLCETAGDLQIEEVSAPMIF